MSTSEWISLATAALLTGRSKRTIRRWIANGDIQFGHDETGAVYVDRAEVLAVEGTKTAYRTHPTFATRRQT